MPFKTYETNKEPNEKSPLQQPILKPMLKKIMKHQLKQNHHQSKLLKTKIKMNKTLKHNHMILIGILRSKKIQ